VTLVEKIAWIDQTNRQRTRKAIAIKVCG